MAQPTDVPWAVAAADFARWEGRFAYMYLDTRGFVTVGVGKMLPDVAAAQALGFVRRSDGQPATAAEIKADFERVKQQPMGRLAKTYKASTLLDLPDAAIDALLESTVAGFETSLSANFAGYEHYPACAKRALLDMVYNLGSSKLLAFKNLKRAVEFGQWAVAAQECERRGPSAERNSWTREMFLKAAE